MTTKYCKDLLSDGQRQDEMLRLLEEVADKAQRKGLLAEDMVRAMLATYVGSRLFGGCTSVEALLEEVEHEARRLLETSPTETDTEAGHIACVTKLTREKAEYIRDLRKKGFTRSRIAETCHAEWQGDWGPPWSEFVGGQLILEASECLGEPCRPWNEAAAASEALEKRVYERVAEIFRTDEGVDGWLRTPRSDLDGKSPISILYDGVSDAFKRIDSLLPVRLWPRRS